jgi:hypothetical protein
MDRQETSQEDTTLEDENYSIKQAAITLKLFSEILLFILP